MDPLYHAIVDVATRCGFPMADEQKQVLGLTSYSYVRAIYRELTVENFEDLDENDLA